MNRHHRFDQDASARRARAQAHLARVRGKRDPRRGARDDRRFIAPPSLRLGRSSLLVVALASWSKR